MAYETTLQILERLKKVHHDLGEYYGRLGDAVEKERVSILLNYMRQHEENFEKIIERFEAEADKGILDTWFKNTPIGLPEEFVEDLELDPATSIGEVIALAEKIDLSLFDFYRSLAENAVAKEVKALFEDLLHQQVQEEHSRSRDAVELTDL